MSDEENKLHIVVVRNPPTKPRENRNNMSWFYNTFLGNIAKKDPGRYKEKVHWILALSNEEIKLAKSRSCGIFNLGNGSTKVLDKQKEDIFMEPYAILKKLFEDVINDDSTQDALVNLFNDIEVSEEDKEKIKRTIYRHSGKNTIRTLLTENGKPTESYHTILKTNKLLEEIQDKED